MIEHYLEVDGRRRLFLVHQPSRPNGAAVVVLHGAGATAAWTAGETLWKEAAEREGFTLAIPEGLPINPDQPAHFLRNPQVWDDGSDRKWLQRRPIDDVGFIAGVVEHLIDREGVNPGRICATGFSNGSSFLFRLAVELPRWAAIAPVASHCWLTEPALPRVVPTVFLIGDSDPIVPLEGGMIKTPWGVGENKPTLTDTLRLWARALGMPEEESALEEDDTQRVSNYGPLLRVHIIRGLGHHWPGGKGQLSQRVFGPQAHAVDANKIIWRFFRQQMGL